METLREFKNFIARGNVVDLAIAVVLGVAFAALVKAFVADILTPIIAMIFGSHDFSALTFTINGSHFLYGDFITALITFVTTALAIFFFVVKPYNALMSRRAKEAPTVKACPECTSEIPIKARRCPFCTAQLTAAWASPA